MRFSHLSIDGYGRFVGKELELAPGLQVIAGPNERGKSTLRYFISDMLYGQKRSSTRRLYEDSNELRMPWAARNGYGGRIVYSLDSGRSFEVERNFDSAKEHVRIFDRTDARDVTNEFPALKNRESMFAEEHLRMTKSVFLGIATISHVSLSDLGDKQALISIREKLLSLADSGGVDSSAERAVKWLQDRIAVIGQPAARTKPLPLTRQRLTDLQAEFQEVHEATKEVVVYEKQRASVLGTIGGLIYRRSSLELELQHRESFERAELLRKAEALEGRVEAITKQCFALGASREFPLERLPEVQRIATLADRASEQLERTQERFDELEQQFSGAVARLEDEGVSVMKEADPASEARLAELDQQIGRLNDRLQNATETCARAETGEKQAREALAAMADFDQFLPDPVRFFSELASQFSVALHARDDEEGRLGRIRQLVQAKEDDLSDSRELFEGHDDFITDLRNYESTIREHRGASGHFEQETILLNQQSEDLRGKVPGFLILALGSLCVGGVVALVAKLTGNEGVYIPACILGVMFLFYGGSALLTRRRLHSTQDRLAEIEEEEIDQVSGIERERTLIEGLMKQAKCHAPRELEALYDRYQQGLADLGALRNQEDEQEDLLRAADEYLEKRRAEVKKAFESAGTTVEGDEDIVPASTRVIARYQEYRDAVRLCDEFKEAVKRLTVEEQELNGELKTLKTEELDLALAMREFLRENHYPEEQNFDSALKAVRAYRIRSAQSRKDQNEIDVAQGQIKIVRRELEAHQAELAAHREALDRLFKDAGVASLGEFAENAERARSYAELWKERATIQEQLDTLLGDTDIDALRKACEAEPPPAAVAKQQLGEASLRTVASHQPEEALRLAAFSKQQPAAPSTKELKDELAAVNEELDSKRKQEHALHLMMTERGAGLRTLNEVDEERAATEQRMAELELELQAASHAVSVIEEVTREQHSRIAPKLANLASEYLKEITNGVYDELLVDRDMQISVRIPETKSLNSEPERRLSKGTVDQIYFALRLAMVRSMSTETESIPMVLDDPFANYDDTRLACAMRLLGRVGETNQVLVFTCRDDVVRAAQAVNAPILQL